MAEIFVKRLRELDGEAKRRLAASLKATHYKVVIRSVFPLSPPLQAEVCRAVRETLAAEVQVQFETAPDLIGGVELEAGGERVVWSLSNYLASLEQSVKEWDAKQEVTHAGTT